MKTLYIAVSIMLFGSLLSGTLYFYKHPNRFARERYVTIGAILMTLYSLFCILIFCFANIAMYIKSILLVCGLSPFIIGYYTTYKRLNVFAAIQLLVIAIGLYFTITKF